MVSEVQVVNELETYFRAIGLEVQRNKHFSLPQDIEWHSYIEIDLMIKKGDIEIPIEVKSRFNPSSIQKGIGQALSYLIFFEESWLAIPYRAVGLVETILRKTKLQSFKVLDWENKVLYEYHDGKVIGNACMHADVFKAYCYDSSTGRRYVCADILPVPFLKSFFAGHQFHMHLLF